MTYLIFSYDAHDSGGGFFDLKHTCDDIEEVKALLVPILYEDECIDIGWCCDDAVTILLHIWVTIVRGRVVERTSHLPELEKTVMPLLTDAQTLISNQLSNWLDEYNNAHPEFRCDKCYRFRPIADKVTKQNVERLVKRGYPKETIMCSDCSKAKE